jgi:hypothetical protein
MVSALPPLAKPKMLDHRFKLCDEIIVSLVKAIAYQRGQGKK